MSTGRRQKTRRILVVDDNVDIHHDFRKILCEPAAVNELDMMSSYLFGAAAPDSHDIVFEIDSAYQGAEALELVQRSQDSANPYMLIFMDVRMPPGLDGIETLSRIW